MDGHRELGRRWNRSRSTKRRRAVFLNNYDVGSIIRYAEEGRVARPHTWGADALDRAGFEVTAPRFRASRADPGTTRSRFYLGDLPNQFRALLLLRGATVLVIAEPKCGRALCLLRRLRLLRVPVVLIVHPEVPIGRLPLLALQGADHRVCLSVPLQAAVHEAVGGDTATTSLAWWGPDLVAPHEPVERSSRLVASGMTFRDLETLAAAAEQAGVPVRYVAGSRQAASDAADLFEDVTFAGSWQEASDEIARALAVVIPLRHPAGTYGLTELNEALRRSTAVVVTFPNGMGVDPEREGFGLGVPRGDVTGLAHALQHYQDNPEQALAAGRRGRAYAEAHLSYERFCTHLLGVVDRLGNQ